MDQRVALITGAMGGLGTALCRRLEADGFAIVATHSPTNVHNEQWLAEQRGAGMVVRAYGVDVADARDCQQLVGQILADLGRIDVLVNNAGITRDASLRKMSVEDWHAVIKTNLDSVFNMSQPVLEAMMSRRWGRIINISSVNAQSGAFGQTNYAAAKAGMHGFTKSLALEVARYGITVNTVSPGYLDTKMVRQIAQQILHERILPQIPVGRLGQPAEVAGLVAYLASEAAAFITGADLAINGGQHMQ